VYCYKQEVYFVHFLKLVAKLVEIDLGILTTGVSEVSGCAPILLEATSKDSHAPLVLLPPVRCCLTNGCVYAKKGDKTGHPTKLRYPSNKVAEATLFDVSGNQRKIYRPNLLCRKCGSAYHYDMYYNKTDKKYRFYVDHIREYVCVTQDTFWPRSFCQYLIESV
jgi:hypothetical protein